MSRARVTGHEEVWQSSQSRGFAMRNVEVVKTLLFDLVPSSDIVLQRMEAGGVVFKEGDTPRGVYLLYSGEVDLVFSAQDGRHTKPLPVAEPGQILGVSAVVAGHPHEFSATAKTPVMLGFICRDAFMRALEANPNIWFSVLNVLSNDVGEVYDNMRELVLR
jgi:CRP-like cAMP-binding protein